jgi:serine/threonine protein kinase
VIHRFMVSVTGVAIVVAALAGSSSNNPSRSSSPAPSQSQTAQPAPSLGDAHSDQMVHRDVKPGNILLADDFDRLVHLDSLMRPLTQS